MQSKNIVFIGTYAEGEYLKDLISGRVYNQLAANQTEAHYIRGLSDSAKSLHVISALVMPSFPSNKELLIHRHIEHTGKYTVENVGFLNLPFIRFFSQIINLRKATKRWTSDKKEDVLVIVYAMRLPFYLAAKYIKRRIPKAVCINIVPDIPIYMHTDSSSYITGMKSWINQKLLLSSCKFFDGFVLYAEAMNNVLKCRGKSIVIEGIISSSASTENKGGNDQFSENKNIVMYAGGLYQKYGVKTLLDGFLGANIPNSEIHFYGVGDCVEEICQISKKDDRVFYHGLVSPENIQIEMKKASLLVNPRPVEEEFTKYSCPSKTLEYMASGTPLLTTKLQGIPDEYFDYVYTIDECSVEGIAHSLKKCFSESFEIRFQKGRMAQEFIMKNKTERIQVERLLTFADERMKHVTS